MQKVHRRFTCHPVSGKQNRESEISSVNTIAVSRATVMYHLLMVMML